MRQIRFMVRSRRYTACHQLQILKSKYEGSTGICIRGGFEWYFTIQPKPLSDTYKIKILYKERSFPETYVVSPKPLALADGAEKLPHTYDTKRQQLCLFNPNYYEWNSSMLIADTIVHWATMWLVYYENWVLTGKWLGGGHGNWDTIKEIKKERF